MYFKCEFRPLHIWQETNFANVPYDHCNAVANNNLYILFLLEHFPLNLAKLKKLTEKRQRKVRIIIVKH